jgi:hypothetical protein
MSRTMCQVYTALTPPPPKGQSRVMKLWKQRPPTMAVSQPVGEDDAVVPEWMMKGCSRQRRRPL